MLLSLAGCASPERLLPGTAARPEVRAIDVGIANVFVVMGKRPILVDTGTAGSTEKLEAGLRDLGVEPRDLALVVITHGHADHCGGATRVRELSGAKVVAGAADLEVFERGYNRPMNPIGVTAHLIKPFIAPPFPGFTPDILVTPSAQPLDLRPFGVDGHVIPAPGHTPGSLVVVLDDGDALVGDMLSGGYFGGALRPQTPTRHYFHDDREAAEAHLAGLVKLGCRRLFLGHGGPVDAREAAEALAAR